MRASGTGEARNLGMSNSQIPVKRLDVRTVESATRKHQPGGPNCTFFIKVTNAVDE
jgi:hypothetical protein